MPCSLYWGLGSSRLYHKTSSMPSAACLPMEGIQCECPLRSSGLTGEVNLAHSRFRCTLGELGSTASVGTAFGTTKDYLAAITAGATGTTLANFLQTRLSSLLTRLRPGS
jgi:hypothetical protein